MSNPHPSYDINQLDLQRFQLLINGISDYAIYMLDPSGVIISWNEGARKFKGYESYEIIGHHFSRFYSPVDRADGVPERALKTAQLEGKFEGEGWRIRKDGTRFWASVVIDPIRDAEGRLIGFGKITRDITERKQALEALRLSEQQFRLLVQGVTDYAIYMLDTQGIVTNWNAGAQRIKGYARDEVVGSHFSRFYTDEDRASNLPVRALSIARETGRFEQEGWRVRKDGSRFMAHVIIDSIYDDDGILIGFAKVTRDVTEKQEAAAALKASEQALQQSQKLETIGKLTGGVAHDFNNLLQIIAGNLHLLQNEIRGNERAQNRLARALAGVGRGAKLASQLLAFGRRQPLEPKVVNVSQFLNNFEDMVQRSLGEAIEMDISASPDLWNCQIDAVQLENALLNLAINARDAMQGIGKLSIEASNAFLDETYTKQYSEVNAGQYIALTVQDTGAGMSPEVMAQAFEPFFSTKPEGKGSGLGLSMVYGFAKQSGGHVDIRSELGVGTTITMYLPRATAAEEGAAHPDQKEIVGGSETVLVAEDEEEVRNIVVEMLDQLGYQVLKAADAQSALAIVESGIHIDLLFTDVVMPGSLRSPDLARKARERLPNIAVLFTSGYTQDTIMHDGRLDAGVELLSKPYTRETLAKKIRQALGNQRERNAQQSEQP